MIASRPRRAVLALVAIAVVGAIGGWALGGRDDTPTELTGTEAAVLPSSEPAVANLAAESTDPRQSPAGEDEVELCGGRWTRLGADGKPDGSELQLLSWKAADDVSRAAVATMTASPSPRLQAAARYFLAGRAAGIDRMREECAEPGCQQIAEGWKAAGEGQRDALARLAQVTDDAQVYAWAYRSCHASPAASATGACAQIGAAQWARLDATDAEPWLALAEEARAHQDPSALDDAMFHVAAAETHRSGWATLAATLADHVAGGDASLLGAQVATLQAVGIEAVDSTGWLGSLGYCASRELGEANRRETCERVASLLTDRSTAGTARNVGIDIGRQLGWPEDRLQALTDRRAVEDAAGRRGNDPAVPDATSCKAMRAGIDRLRAIAEFGELEMLRRDVAAGTATKASSRH